MNMSAISGTAIATDRPIVRAGSRDSPASSATYSKPLKAPSASLPKMFRLNGVSVGADAASGWYSGMAPR
jgi:hypothetical protein